MTEWKRFNGRRTCGHCSDPIPAGALARVITFVSEHKRYQLVRCEACSRLDGLYPPAEVPPAPRPRPSTTRDPLTPIAAIAGDFKSRQVGEDDE